MGEALTRLAEIDPDAGQVVKLRLFVALTEEEATKGLRALVSTVERLWAYARAWLFREMTKESQAIT